jgi:hypothetical protein
MIGIMYWQRWGGKWSCDGIGSQPQIDMRANECVWLFPWVTRDMCWAESV